jgi:hypothetical protein
MNEDIKIIDARSIRGGWGGLEADGGGNTDKTTVLLSTSVLKYFIVTRIH